MFMRGARVTFTNEMMKNSVVTFMSQNTDMRHDMMLSFRVHLTENALLLVQVFPSGDEAAEYEPPSRRLSIKSVRWAQRSKFCQARCRISRWRRPATGPAW